MSLRVLGMLCALLLISVASPLSAQPVPYELNSAGSDYTFGCYPPCLCPIFIGENMTGSFDLTFESFDGQYNNYTIENVDWSTAGSQLSGSGTYRVTAPGGPADLMQEISLELMINGVTHLIVSGLQPTSDIFPTIQIAAAENGFFCFDHTVTIDASPLFAPLPAFVRGDCNVDNSFDIADAIFALNQLFIPGGTQSTCSKACDGNDDGNFNLADAITILARLFALGTIPPPFPSCGTDPTADGLSCDSFGFCP